MPVHAPFAALRLTVCLAAAFARVPGALVAQGRPSAAPAPVVVTAGRVVLPRAADTVPVPGARVLLHRVGRDTQGPLDSTSADASGNFRFRFRADTSALYLLSARYADIEYFSAPVHTNPARPDTAVRLVVYDTSSTAPIEVEARHIVVPRAAANGTRPVLDLIVLLNSGRLARVAPDSSRPSWRLVLPPATGDMQVGQSDLSADAVVREGDTVKVLAPLAPGQKQLSLEYGVLPSRGRIEFAVGPSGGRVNVLVEERDVRVSGGTLALADSQVIEGRSFRRYTGDVPAGGAVVLDVGGVGPSATSRWGLPGLVTLVALALAAAAVWLIRRPRPATAASRERILDAIAVLDARFAGREADTAAEEWQRYVSERARLKAELEGALAAQGRPPYS